MNEQDQLDSIVDNQREVPVQWRNPATGQLEKVVVRVGEVTMKNFKAFAAACAPFFGEFGEAGRLGRRLDTETGDRQEPQEFALFHVLADHSDAFMAAAAMVTNKPATFYQELAPDQFFDVASAVVKVNGDFFIRSLAPVLLKMGRVLGTIGSTTSNS